MTDALEIPAFLRGSRPGPKPRWKTPWRMPKAKRPEGTKWETAERWEVTVNPRLVPQGADGDKTARVRPGTRYVWVIPGKTWTEIRDSEAYAKISTADWHRMSRTGKIIVAS